MAKRLSARLFQNAQPPEKLTTPQRNAGNVLEHICFANECGSTTKTKMPPQINGHPTRQMTIQPLHQANRLPGSLTEQTNVATTPDMQANVVATVRHI